MSRRTILDYSRAMPAGWQLADPFGALDTLPAAIDPRPLPQQRDRCDGSLQLAMTAEPGPCPVCGRTVATVTLDGAPVLVEHRPHRADALPMSLDL